MNHFIVRALGAVAGGVLAVGVSAAGIASATGDDGAAAPVVATSAVGGQPAPAAVPLAAEQAPTGSCHLVWVNIFGPVCMPGR
ncbi:hypothetical protein KIH27_21130 [Mycobacterium sp. M1]|uniref:Uncharacterized protein n=1 Tax=Mycolicibacter acidiphilus TaxID=2835306 RepID=A0ABS5RP69_9MYCO|nr:hypothetical protein [Mycolicibacter acidiphilus]MBS9536090.1 hypothetical protein [Mycolicibacter acidiphilus]